MTKLHSRFAKLGNGAADRELMLRVAWRHLVDGRTQESVAREFGLTRAKVNRLIAECREAGLVRIGINSNARIALDEEFELRDRFGLVDAWVVPATASGATATHTVGVAAGGYVSETLGPDQTLAVGWGHTLNASVLGLQPRKAQGNRVVNLLGGLVRGSQLNSFEITSRYARTLNAECCYLIAPRMADSDEAAQHLRERPYIKEALDIAASAQMLLVGVGELSAASTLCKTGLLSVSDLGILSSAGAVCILQGTALDLEGRQISHPLAGRTVGLAPDRFGQVPKRILAASGRRKARSIRALLKGGHCNVLITDETTAAAVLALSA